MEEEWRDAVGFPGYRVSSFGRVLGVRGNIRKPCKIKGGYLKVNVRDASGKLQNRRIHTLVCMAFNGCRPSPKHGVRHLDGDPSNNHKSNLKWGTPKENAEDKILHGSVLIGDRNPKAKLSDEQMTIIREDYVTNLNRTGTYVKRGTVSRLAKQYNVGESAIRDIGRGRTW